MKMVFTIMLAISMFSTLMIMFAGIFMMAKKDQSGGKVSNRLMQWRVMMQGIAIFSFVGLVLSA